MSSLFGKWVKINSRLVRSVGTPLRIDRARGVFQIKEWRPRRITPVEVLVIGKRTLQNGETVFSDGGDAIVWNKKGGGVPAYLVVERELFRPYYVHRDAVVEVLDNANP